MTRKEIQEVIDKGGALISDFEYADQTALGQFPEIHFGNLYLIGDQLHFDNAVSMDKKMETFGQGMYHICLIQREATEEEIKRYVK